MITVIKNGKAKRVCCPHCESILECEIDDLRLGNTTYYEFYWYILCPVCRKVIDTDYCFANIQDNSRAKRITFNKLK